MLAPMPFPNPSPMGYMEQVGQHAIFKLSHMGVCVGILCPKRFLSQATLGVYGHLNSMFFPRPYMCVYEHIASFRFNHGKMLGCMGMVEPKQFLTHTIMGFLHMWAFIPCLSLAIWEKVLGCRRLIIFEWDYMGICHCDPCHKGELQAFWLHTIFYPNHIGGTCWLPCHFQTWLYVGL